MAKIHPDTRAFNGAIRKHIKHLLHTGVTRPQMQEVLGVTKQAISSYVIGRTTPKPYIVKRLLTKWPSKDLSYRGMHPTAADFDVPTPTIKMLPQQGDLFALLSAIGPQDLKIEVDRMGVANIEMKVLIRIAG
jgi:hypothetical protein